MDPGKSRTMDVVEPALELTNPHRSFSLHKQKAASLIGQPLFVMT